MSTPAHSVQRYTDPFDCDDGDIWLSDLVDGGSIDWDLHQEMVTAYSVRGHFVVQTVGKESEWIKGSRVNVIR